MNDHVYKMEVVKYQHEKGWKEYLFSKAWANIAWFFVGSFSGNLSLNLLALRINKPMFAIFSPYIVIVLVGCKEMLDEISKHTKYQGRFGLDPAGADYRDILLAIIGILVSLPLMVTV